MTVTVIVIICLIILTFASGYCSGKSDAMNLLIEERRRHAQDLEEAEVRYERSLRELHKVFREEDLSDGALD